MNRDDKIFWGFMLSLAAAMVAVIGIRTGVWLADRYWLEQILAHDAAHYQCDPKTGTPELIWKPSPPPHERPSR